jgi:hypothetical protein
MSENDEVNLKQQRLDAAVSNRLSRLASMPVEMASLEAAMQREIGGAAGRRRIPWLRPVQALAASLLAVGLLVAALVMSGGPAQASSSDLARVHQDMVSGGGHVVPVSSMDAANRAVAEHWPDAPQLPGVQGQHVMACCVHQVGREQVACAALKVDGVAVSMAVADSKDLRMPPGETVRRGGKVYRVQSSGTLHMAMHERDGRWACLMGEAPVERLVDLLETLTW